MSADEEMGGDPACWSHVFDSQEPSSAIDLVERAQTAPGRGPIWTQQSDDLNVNLLRFSRGEGVGEHINNEVDVLLIGVSGDGYATIDGSECPLPVGHLLMIPKGAVRSITATGEYFSYLSCHRRRDGLMPKKRDKG